MGGARAPWIVDLLLLGMGALPVHAQSVEIAGIVVDESIRPMPVARVLVVSHGVLNLDSHGQFRMVLNDGTSSVELELVEPEGHAVLYPPRGFDISGGRRSLYIIVGRSREQVIVGALSDQIANLERNVNAKGDAQYVEIRRLREDLLQAFEPILARLEIDKETLRQSIEDRERKVAIGSDIKEILNPYLLRIKDLRDFLAELTPRLAEDPAAFEGLQRVMADYSSAYATLDAKKDSFRAAIDSAWGGVRGQGLQRDWEVVRVQAVRRMHLGLVLPLNPALIVLQRIHTTSQPSKAEVDEALSSIRKAVDLLTLEIPVLEEQRDLLYMSLDTP